MTISSTWINLRFAEEPAPILCWIAARLLDRSGSGKVMTTIKELAQLLQKSEPSIKRYLRQGLGLGYFRQIVKPRGTGRVILFLSSAAAICRTRDITAISGAIELTAEDLIQSRLRSIATEAEALRLQRASLYAARKSYPGSTLAKVQFVPGSEDYFKKQSSSIGHGASAEYSSRFTKVSGDHYSHGGSQKTIAVRINRCQRTVQRRLSNRQRQAVGLSQLDRTQLLKSLPIGALSNRQVKFLMGSKSKINLVDETGRSIKVALNRFIGPIIGSTSAFEGAIGWIYKPNLYNSDLIVRRDRKLKRELSKPAGSDPDL